MGEECGYVFVCDILAEAIKPWNAAVDHLQDMMNDPDKFLARLQDHTDGQELEDGNPEAAVDKLAEKLGDKLLKIDMKDTYQNFLKLSCTFVAF